MIILDARVLSYAVGSEHPLRAPCLRLLQAHTDGAIEVTTTVEVIQEFLQVRSMRRSREDAATLAHQFIATFSLISTQPEDLELGLTLYQRHPALGAFDAALVAVALNRRVDALVSADKAFGTVPHFPWIDPATPALDVLLGRMQP